MAIIYYKNPQLTSFSKLTYKDFGAAPAFHTHTHEDIYMYDIQGITESTSNGTEIPQVLTMTQGGTGIINKNNPESGGYQGFGLYYGNILDDTHIQYLVGNKKMGVLHYTPFNLQGPIFSSWPVAAGGTGCTSQKDTIHKFNIGLTNQIQSFIIPLNLVHITDAYITNNATMIEFSLLLPYHLLLNTTGWISLYILFSNQHDTNAVVHSKFLYGFTMVPFIVGNTPNTTRDCITKYGFDNEDVGPLINGTQQGHVTIFTTGIDTTVNNIYPASNIITIRMELQESIVDDNENLSFVDNTPIVVSLDKTNNNTSFINQIGFPAIGGF